MKSLFAKFAKPPQKDTYASKEHTQSNGTKPPQYNKQVIHVEILLSEILYEN
jgi:hypothetical protein